jgi:hypothetical protein
LALAGSPFRFWLKLLNCVLPAIVVASGSYSSLDRCVPQGDRLAPQVIHSPCTPLVSTLWYRTSESAPVRLSWSGDSTAIGDGSCPYIDSPLLFVDVYSNWTTAKIRSRSCPWPCR